MKSVFLSLFLALFLLPYMVSADIPDSYTNGNIFTSEHDAPVSISFDGSGGFYGHTNTGQYYTQTPIENTFGVRIHKFTIGEAYFYMSDRGLITAEDDLTAFSVYFSRV